MSPDDMLQNTPFYKVENGVFSNPKPLSRGTDNSPQKGPKPAGRDAIKLNKISTREGESNLFVFFRTHYQRNFICVKTTLAIK